MIRLDDVYKTLWLMLVAFCTVSAVIVASFLAGYYSELYRSDVREARCINSACDTPCRSDEKFVRHKGCAP